MTKEMRRTRREKKFWYHWVKVSALLCLYDILVMNLAYGLALLVRFDMQFQQIPREFLRTWTLYAPVHTVCTLILLVVFKLYRSIWRFASFDELERVTIVSILSAVLHVLGTMAFFERMPVSYYLFGAILMYMGLTGIRFSYRFLRMMKGKATVDSNIKRKNVMIVGAGAAGQTLMREYKQSEKLNSRLCCFIDDNPNKLNRLVDGIPVVGDRHDIPYMVKKYKVDKIVIALPTASKEDKKEIINIAKETGCELLTIPGTYQLIKGEVSVSSLRQVSIEELLGRDSIKMDIQEVSDYIKGRVVLVTGGGGSIGSELCRQIAKYGAKTLIIFDIYENSAYEIQQELKRHHPEVELHTLIGSVRDVGCLEKVFKTYHPEVVFHAAAHKHVPLMEDSPNEAIKNNVFGTFNTARIANEHGTKKFVLISTDKAVNPTNIMGASKRLCEMVIQTMARQTTGTQFAMVRFGNVLGSNGSVIPLFKKQIEEGGPVTVTSPDIIRYFMTIPEAVSLVLTAGSYAKGGEIFVLDMGEPVKIADLAKNLIKLSGLKVGEDIEIKYTGLRPGEKLYEELLMAEEGLKKTDNNLIFIGEPIEMDDDTFLIDLAELKDFCYNEGCDIRSKVKELVPTYHPENGQSVSAH
ncbi:nucleoside-diphosphate sugar epimerase/dehydratase [Sellimonas catena]|uniref:UDP-N-acetylglucosamine 4,6-dehydratase n=1 Tax=Sellimonas catena TaxID=2994035 RepID=A0A9W6CCA8_9FIRM|nr:nucleoside-diphosphate sugar epimerase/dehydratase [Sellimonas catena]GLG89486.1 UDP-N-acetylglucosamine 4,6-dehydratase [Sellimonas catena]